MDLNIHDPPGLREESIPNGVEMATASKNFCTVTKTYYAGISEVRKLQVGAQRKGNNIYGVQIIKQR